MVAVGVALNSVPLIVTVVPIGPDEGKNAIVSATMVKLDALAEVTPLTVTVIAPEVAPEGTVVVIVVAVLAVTAATVPLKLAWLLEGVGSKSIPEMITGVPKLPDVGENETMLVTKKLTDVVMSFTFTVSNPVVAPTGIEVVIPVEVLDVTVAEVPLNATVLLAGVGSKSIPVMVMVAPVAPNVGESDVIFNPKIMFRRIEIEEPVVTTNSGRPSPSRSPMVILFRSLLFRAATGKSAAAPKEFVPIRQATVVFLRTETIMLIPFVTAKSGFPSPSKSSMPISPGTEVVAKSTFSAKELPSIEPGILVFLITEIILSS